MAKLTVLRFPDQRLRKKAAPVQQVNDDIRKIVEDMKETMYAENGVGLAATQVNIHQQIIVLDVSREQNNPICLINPEIIQTSKEKKSHEEGCLSVPEYFADVDRAASITIRALDEHGQSHETQADDLLAVCIQHEMDHLQGKLFVDYLSPLKQQRVRKKMEKLDKLDKLEKQHKQNQQRARA
ncbi:MAG: peptide deformylase [bacterium]